MNIYDLISYLKLRDFNLCGLTTDYAATEIDPKTAAFTWAVDSNIVVVINWLDDKGCFEWHVASHWLSKSKSFIVFKPLTIDQADYVDFMFDALNRQIQHWYDWVMPLKDEHAHTEDFWHGN